MNITGMYDDLVEWWNSLRAPRKITPADFRRGAHKQPKHIIGISIDHNSANRGLFMGGIVPMKRRFKGVSRTAGKS